MAIFKRLFGGSTGAHAAGRQSEAPTPPAQALPPSVVPAAALPAVATDPLGNERPAWMRDGMSATVLVGNDNLSVVGESNYQGNLKRWAVEKGATIADGVRIEHFALLAAEPQNPFDPNAVSVWVDGLKVGYLSRSDARELQPGLIRLHDERGPIALQAVIAGGGPRDDGIGMLGVFLSYDPEDFGVTYAPVPVQPAQLRTGLTDAMTTDAADDSYDLSWFDHLPEDRARRVAMVRGLLDKNSEPISRHFMLSVLEEDLYKMRDLYAQVLDEFDAVCAQHDQEMAVILPALIDKFGVVPLLDFYRQASVRHQKAHNYEKAWWWADRGLQVYGEHSARAEWVQDLQERAARNYNKMHGIKPDTTSTNVNGVEHLTCQRCGRVWQREVTRGRKPHECPDCRAKGAATLG